MRTKTLLLAAAFVAAGIASSEAQNVYSANVVGYVTLINPVGGQFTLVENPLDDGVDTITDLFPNAPNQTVVETWTGTGFTQAKKVAGNWNTNLYLFPGTGFFLQFPASAGPVTNTFIGNVAVQSSDGNGLGTNTTALPAGVFKLAGSPFPIADTLTGTNINLGNSLTVNQSIVEIWTGTGYTQAKLVGGVWNTNLNLSVGEAYFIDAKGATNWTEVLP